MQCSVQIRKQQKHQLPNRGNKLKKAERYIIVGARLQLNTSPRLHRRDALMRRPAEALASRPPLDACCMPMHADYITCRTRSRASRALAHHSSVGRASDCRSETCRNQSVLGSIPSGETASLKWTRKIFLSRRHPKLFLDAPATFHLINLLGSERR